MKLNAKEDVYVQLVVSWSCSQVICRNGLLRLAERVDAIFKRIILPTSMQLMERFV